MIGRSVAGAGTVHRHRIALVVPGLELGGGVPAVARFLRNVVLDSGDYEVTVVSIATSACDSSSVRLFKPATWFRGPQTRHSVWDGSPIQHVGAFLTEIEFQRYRRRSQLTDLVTRADLIQVVSGTPAWALPVVGLGKPVVLQVATRTILERRRKEVLGSGVLSSWRWMMTRVTERLDRRALESVDAVLVENPDMARFVKAVLAGCAEQVRYAPPGVDTHELSPVCDRVRSRAEPHYVLAVGRFDDPRKNPDLLLEAYARLCRRVSTPPVLVLAGAGDPGSRFWSRVHELGLDRQVSHRHQPSRAELVKLYQNALCLALPSDEEGFGLVVVEAMACGVPVVATRCGGPEGILTDGHDGYLVPRDDPIAFADRLECLSGDMARNRLMGTAARATVEEAYSEEVAGAAFLQVYQELLRSAEM